MCIRFQTRNSVLQQPVPTRVRSLKNPMMDIHRGGMCDADSGKSMWNSQGIRISKEVLKEADIAVDDILDVIVSNGANILVKPFRHKTVLLHMMECFTGVFMFLANHS